MTDEHDDITRMLADFREGDRAAFDRLFSLLYDELRRRAHFQLRQAGGAASLATTDLVHELYLKLAGSRSPDWEGRRHFYRVAARAMRQVVIDRARKHLAAKRGGAVIPLDIDDLPIPAADASEQLLALELALSRLEQESPRAARVMELTYFVGLSVEQAAEVFGSSDRTIKRLRQFGRAFLHRHLAVQTSASSDTREAARDPG